MFAPFLGEFTTLNPLIGNTPFRVCLAPQGLPHCDRAYRSGGAKPAQGYLDLWELRRRRPTIYR